MKLIIPLLLLAGISFGQHAVYNDFSPAAVRGITIGTLHCYFWSGGIVPPPYTLEVACYDNSPVPQLFFSPPGKTSSHTIFLDASSEVTFVAVPNIDGKHWDLTLTGKGPSDTTELPLIKVTL